MIYAQGRSYTIHHADSMDVDWPEAQAIITDPPYSQNTHDNAKTNKTGGKLVTFNSITWDQLWLRLQRIQLTGWMIATVDYHMIEHFERCQDWRFVRYGVWAKPNACPQFGGDRPGHGFEAVAIMHSHKPRRLKWNGGGKSAVWLDPVQNPSDYPTQKPLSLIRSFVALFCQPGDVIADPFCGSGTTLVAGLERGHTVIGADISEQACELAAKRCEQVEAQGRLF